MKNLLLSFMCFMLLCACTPNRSDAEVQAEIQSEELPVRIAMIDGTLYRDSGKVSDLNPRCGTLDGEVVKTVEANKIPFEDHTSNFGDYGYQNATETSKQFNINGDWVIFERYYDWGLNVRCEDITRTGLSVLFEQSGGNATGELQTGDWYTLERFEDGVWKTVTYKPQEHEVAWHSIAYGIKRDGETSFEVKWERLYGELPDGKYRIGKQVNDFRGTGDYDSSILYGEFDIDEEICAYPEAEGKK